MQDSTEKNKSGLVSGQKLLKQENLTTSENLPKSVSLKLYELMNSVVEQEVNPRTVSAACACATEIHRMLKLNLEIRKQTRD